MGMSSEGPKMGGGRYGSAWNGQKIGKSNDPVAFAGPIRASPTAVGREILPVRSPHPPPPLWLESVQRGGGGGGGGRNRLPRPKPVWPKNGSK